MKKVAIFFHGGSKNHDWEAIVRSSISMLRTFATCQLFLCSLSEDRAFKFDEACPIVQLGQESKHHKTSIRDFIKQFFVFNRDDQAGAQSMSARITDTLDLFGLQSRHITKPTDLTTQPIDYAPVRAILDQCRKESLDWLMVGLIMNQRKARTVLSDVA